MPVRTSVDRDAIVVGLGFSGIYMLHQLRNKLGLDVLAVDKAAGVGGTWFWNRYPGALSDSPSHLYCFAFDDELLQDWTFPNRYVSQPQALAYLEHLVDRYDLTPSIRLNTEVLGARFDDATDTWNVTFGDGTTLSCRYFITAVGVTHEPVLPDIPGREGFEGVACHTSRWPEHLDVTGKRVAVIGSGSSGTQVVTAIAPIVDRVTAFVRSPQYIVPVGNRPLTETEISQTKANYKQIWDEQFQSVTAFGIEHEPPPHSALEVSDDEREAAYEHAWEFGGPFHFYVGTFNDLVSNPAANDTAADFIRRKISEIVRDPDKARKLSPTEPWARRPVADNGYYESFNRDNVDLIDLREVQISEITAAGILTSDGVEREFDVIVFATGFDSLTGAFNRMDIRGHHGHSLQDQWRDGAATYLAVAVSNFPNMFTAYGPYGPFANNPPLIASEVEFIASLIRHAEETGASRVAVNAAAEQAYVKGCEKLAHQTMMYDVASWINGGNVPGKPRQFMFNMAGLREFRELLAAEADGGYPEFSLSK